MSNKTELLARIYGYILSAEWGCNKLLQNQNTSPDAANDRSWPLTEREDKPHSPFIITDGKRGE